MRRTHLVVHIFGLQRGWLDSVSVDHRLKEALKHYSLEHLRRLSLLEPASLPYIEVLFCLF